MENKSIDRAIVFSGIVILIILTYIILRKILFSIFIAFIFAYIFRPLFNSINRRVKIRGISALIILLGLAAIIILPMLFLINPLINQTSELYQGIQEFNIGDFMEKVLPSGISPEVSETIKSQFNGVLSNIYTSAMTSFSSFLKGVPMKLVGLIIFLSIFYFILIDFDKILSNIIEFIPLSDKVKRKFGEEFKNVTDGTIYGQVLIGILQGILMGLIMFILGIKGVLPLTIIAVIVGVLPMIGPTAIWVPLGTVLLITGFPIKALILALWGMGVSASTEYILRPYIISKKTILPIELSFLASVGGLLSFGLIGLVLGPLIVSYLLIVLQFYKQGNLDELFRK